MVVASLCYKDGQHDEHDACWGCRAYHDRHVAVAVVHNHWHVIADNSTEHVWEEMPFNPKVVREYPDQLWRSDQL